MCIKWYRSWHQKKYSHHVHTAVLGVYVFAVIFSMLFSLLPGPQIQQALASAGSWTQTSVADFNGDTLSSTQVTSPGDVKLSGGMDYGTGADGALNTNGFSINTQTAGNNGRTQPDGVNYSVTALTANTATLATTPVTGALKAGDEVLLINQQGISTNTANVGNYEFLKVQSDVTTTTVTFTTNKTKYYGNNASDDTNLGTALTNQRVMLQRVPNYTNVSVSKGSNLFSDTFPGTSLNGSNWVEIDPNNSISVNNGLQLNKVDSVDWTRAIISQQTYNRTTGLTAYGKFTTGAAVSPFNFMFGWGVNQTANPSYTQLAHGLYFAGGALNIYQNGASYGTVGSGFVANTQYEIKVTLYDVGARYYIKGGAYGTSWVMLYQDTTITNTPLRVMLPTVDAAATFSEIDVYNDGILSTSPWDGTKGGALFFRVNGTFTNSGLIDESGFGYKAGVGGVNGCTNYPWPTTAGDHGESYNGANSVTACNRRASVSGNLVAIPVNGGGGGGGAGSTVTARNGGGGGGGGYAAAGSAGTASTSGEAGGGAGASYGNSNIDGIYLGSGGGGGGRGVNAVGTNGGNGGGIIYINATTFTNTGTITTSGVKGVPVAWSDDGGGAGGGGAGGTIVIKGGNLSLGSGLITSAGGASTPGGVGGSFGTGGTGGAGSNGRIRLDYSGTLSGTTSPTPGTSNSVPFSTSGTVIAPIQPAGIYGNWGNITFSASASANGGAANTTLKVQVCDAAGSPINLPTTGGSSIAAGANTTTDSDNATAGFYVNSGSLGTIVLTAVSTATYPSLKLKATLASTNTIYTPILGDWSIQYSNDTGLPTVPTSLTIGTVTNVSIALSWNSSVDTESGLSGYEVQRAPDSSGSPGTWADITTGGCAKPVSTVSCTDNGSVSPNTKYYYRLRAKDNAGNYSGYSGELNADGASVVGLWHLNEGSGTTAADSSGNGNTGTMAGSGYWTAANGGKFGSALSGNGSTNYVTVPHNSSFETDTMTVEAWVKANSWSSADWLGIVGKQVAGGTGPWYMRVTSNTTSPANAITFGQSRSVTGSSTYAPAALSTGQWHYIVGTVDTDKIARLYIDGNLSSSGAVGSGTVVSNAAQPVLIGVDRTSYADEYFNGQIDEVRISNTALSAAAIAGIYTESNAQPKSATTLTATPTLSAPTTPQNSSKPTVAGTGATPSTTVRLYDNGTLKASKASDASGNFTFGTADYSGTLTDGAHTNLTVRGYNGTTETVDSNAISITTDTVYPVVSSFSINSNAQFTNSTTVTLALSATDTGGTGVSQMQFSNDAVSWSTYEAYATSKSWTLATGDGSKTVYLHVKDAAGNVSTTTTTPSGSAVADWQAVTQGNHYGNFYDAVSGTYATVTRAGAKTIYDPKTNKIYDVPANYLGVNPRSDGKGGAEALIEEGRTNYLHDSYFNAQQTVGASYADYVYQNYSSGSITPYNSAPYFAYNTSSGLYGNSLRIRAGYGGTGQQYAGVRQMTASGVAVSGDTWTVSGYIRRNGGNGDDVRLALQGRDATAGQGNYIEGLASASLTGSLTSSWKRFSITYTLANASTSRIGLAVYSYLNSAGQHTDIEFASLQLEKGAFATSFIPTTTTTVARNADVVSVSTSALNKNVGSLVAVANDSLEVPPSGRRIFDWKYDSSNRILMYRNASSYGAVYGYTNATGVASYGTMNKLTAGYSVNAMNWSVGSPTYSYLNGTKGGQTGGNLGAISVTLPATANIGSDQGGNSATYTGFIQRLTAFTSQLSDADITTATNMIKDGQGSIYLDTTAPVSTTSAITSPNGAEKWKGGSSQVVTWNPSALSDATSGFGATPIKLEYTTDGTNYTQIVAATANTGTYTWNPIPTLDSNTVKIRLTVTDNVGLTATDLSDANFIIDSTGPTGTVVINSSEYTNNPAVTLNLNATDPGAGVSQMRFSNTGLPTDWSTWESYATSKPGWDLSNVTYGGTGVQGLKTVYVQFNDVTGNSSATITDTIFWDGQNPTNPTAVTGPSASSAWAKGATPTFNWSGATDPNPTSGIKGYWVYFGTDSNAEPKVSTSSANLAYTDNANSNLYTGITYTVASSLVSGNTYYLKIRTVDNAGNDADSTYTETVNQFVYKFDSTTPGLPAYIDVVPPGMSTVDSFDFSWPAATDNPVNNSGICKYEYRRDTTPAESWTDLGTTRNVSGIHKYKSGTNLFEVRTVDCAGNASDDLDSGRIITRPYYYSDPAALVPQNVQVDTSQSAGGTINLFKFTWNAVTGATKYFVAVNANPTEQSTMLTNPYTGYSNYATQAGLNTFYVVAEDNGGNANWSNPASVTFSVNTTPPAAPSSLSISDASNRSASMYALTVMWPALSAPTPDFNGYQVDRSTDGLTYTKVATVSTNIYSEAGLNEGQRYFYRVRSRDNTGNLSTTYASGDRIPTGKYTAPPTITADPKVTVKAASVNITWNTNRTSNSIVQFGPGNGYGQEISQATTYVFDHSIDLEGLTPGMTYHFRVASIDKDYDYSEESAFSKDFTFTTLPAPGISSVTTSEIRLYSAIVSWKTTSAATSRILYGTTTSYGKNYEDTSGSQTTTHTVKLDNLTDSTSYHYKIQGIDVDGNILTSDDYIFTTLTFPKLDSLKVEHIANSRPSTTKVTFNSNIPTSALITFAGTGGKDASKYTLETAHTLNVTGLSDNTTYNVTAKGRDEYGNESNPISVQYTTPYDTTPPLITDITVETSILGYGVDAKGQIVVSWTTDKPSSSQVEYGSGVGGNDYTSKTQEDTSLTETHVVIISDLKPSSPYHFRVVSKDHAGNVGMSGDNSVLTQQATESILDLIIKSLQSSIGWIFRGFGKRG